MVTNPFQITLRATRISCGYTALEAAQACGIAEGTMNRYETDAGRVPRRTAVQLSRLYGGVSLDLIYWGKESDHFKRKGAESEYDNSTA
ncbi:helix-turn-helix transcriptional regulator [Paenibacillus agricola]|uniref:Helix-turn-helix domain-containing protein n=1 Tax=Paenibacillus agricola TaxID=2716264 RepID=A0ABX0JCQ1_9BACL|nr:helix-turn-helix transcriptional regulator [Paenibacillus agricola]NHN33561.1 helix-turn-helix domain-containing protein [Paenibacillus agricola]